MNTITKYIIKFSDIEETETVDTKRLIEYANNRLEANPEDRKEFSFDTYKLSPENAILVIESYDEEVELITEETELMKIEVTEEVLADIKEEIQLELLKRGFTTPIYLAVKGPNSTNPRIIITSEPFQTTPVLFKSLEIVNFSSSLKKDTLLNINKEEIEFVSVRIEVDVAYEHFDTGTNSSNLFSFHGKIKDNKLFSSTITS